MRCSCRASTRPRGDLDRGPRLELARLHTWEQALDLDRVDAARTEVLRRLRAAGDRKAEAVLRRPGVVASRDEAGEERISRADRGDGLDRRGGDLVDVSFVPALDRGDAALRAGDHGIHRPQLDQAREAVEQVLAIVELMADGSLRLAHVRGDGGWLGANRGGQRLALGVDDRLDA